ncbi:MAG: RNA 2',3'-cyclic phosphodiesterase, partial [Elusimicrobiota bacterium]
MRLFAALAVPPALAALLAGVQESLGPLWPGVKWVPAGHMHVTLKFLGETADDRVSAAGAVLETCASSTAAFPVEIGGLGVFPSERAPRVLWAGVDRAGGAAAS